MCLRAGGRVGKTRLSPLNYITGGNGGGRCPEKEEGILRRKKKSYLLFLIIMMIKKWNIEGIELKEKEEIVKESGEEGGGRGGCGGEGRG